MDQNIFFTVLNTILAAIALAMFYPLYKATNAKDLNEALQTRPALAKAVSRTGSRSYVRTGIYFAASMVLYGAIALGGDDEVDMDYATLSLAVLFVISFAKVWKLRRLLGAPAAPVSTGQRD